MMFNCIEYIFTTPYTVFFNNNQQYVKLSKNPIATRSMQWNQYFFAIP